jgi:FKBP-type peptidyl-prolyl cis-trans isomerase 2
VGESAAITGPNNRDEGRIEIRAMSGETIDIAQYSATTGKTLFFDVEIVDIK